MTIDFRETKCGVVFKVWVVPRATRTEVVGVKDDSLRVRLAALPNKGKANDALVRFFTEKLKISKQQIVIIEGHKSRRKKIAIQGFTASDLRIHLNHLIEAKLP